MQKQAGTLQGLGYVEQNAGGGDPGGSQYHCAGDVTSPPAGLALHPVLCLQALQRGQEEEEEEQEEEGPQPVRHLHIIAAPCFHLPAQDHSANLKNTHELMDYLFFFFFGSPLSERVFWTFTLCLSERAAQKSLLNHESAYFIWWVCKYEENLPSQFSEAQQDN